MLFTLPEPIFEVGGFEEEKIDSQSGYYHNYVELHICD